jgi:hypothetical protein
MKKLFLYLLSIFVSVSLASAQKPVHFNGVDKPLVEGKIQLQSEGCEVYYPTF